QRLLCAEGASCVYGSTHLCGFGGDGRCVAIPSTCPDANNGALYCACNGKLYPSPCAMQKDGTDIATSGHCEAPPERYFPCGFLFCPRGKYCKSTTTESETSSTCEDFPKECSTRDCACLPESLGCS